MKKHSHVFSFAAGMATTALLFTCIAGISAAGGGVSFNSASIILGHSLFAEKGQTIQTAAGADIPATILYTDSNGGGTLYAPLRPMMESIGAEVSWDNELKQALVRLDPSDTLYTMPTEFTGDSAKVDCFQEIASAVPASAAALVPTTRHQSTENYVYEMPAFDSAKGDCVAVTVVNHGAKPVQCSWGFTKPYNDTVATVKPMQVPAGATLTRTVQLIAPIEDQTLYFNVGNPEGMCESCDFEISIAQFSSAS